MTYPPPSQANRLSGSSKVKIEPHTALPLDDMRVKQEYVSQDSGVQVSRGPGRLRLQRLLGYNEWCAREIGIVSTEVRSWMIFCRITHMLVAELGICLLRRKTTRRDPWNPSA